MSANPKADPDGVARLSGDITAIRQLMADIRMKCEDLQEAVKEAEVLKRHLKEMLQAATSAAGEAPTPFGAPSSTAAPVQNLGVVGRGRARITPAALPAGAGQAPAQAAAAGTSATAAGPSAPAPAKRSLGDLMNPAGGVAVNGFGASPAAGEAARPGQPDAKRLKPEGS